jgi:hypothetical protein
VGRRQAFALVAGCCSAADAQILFEIREKKLFRTSLKEPGAELSRCLSPRQVREEQTVTEANPRRLIAHLSGWPRKRTGRTLNFAPISFIDSDVMLI